MGNSRKYPYPTTNGFHFLTYHYLRKFQNTLLFLCPQNSTVTNPAYPLEFPLKHVSDQSSCLSSASRVISLWYLRAKKVHNNSVFKELAVNSFYSRNPTCEILPCLRISSRIYWYRPFLWNPGQRAIPSPSEILESSPRYMVYGYFLELPNNVSTYIEKNILFFFIIDISEYFK